MTDVRLHPNLDVVHGNRRLSRCAGVVALAAVLSLGGGAPVPAPVVHLEQIADADRPNTASPDSWFRIGHLLNDMVRKVRQDDPTDRSEDVVEPPVQPVTTPFQIDLPSLRGRDGR